MAYKVNEKTGEITISGFDQGISPSPHKGIANIQNANLSTEMGEIVASFQRVQQSQTIITTGTLTASSGMGAFYLASNQILQVGTWITISSSTISSLSAGTYYVNLTENGLYQLSLYYDPLFDNSISHGTSGTATFTTATNMAQPIASATEIFNNSSGTQYRYYILDSSGLVWVYDTAVYASSLFISGIGTTWFLPDASTTYFQTAYSTIAPSGLSILNGWLMVFGGHQVWAKSTINLGDTTTNNTTYVAVLNGGSVPSITTTGTISMGATSATLSTTWIYNTGTFSVTFSSGDVRDIVFTNSATGISWTNGLSGSATDVLTLIPTLGGGPFPLVMSTGTGENIPHTSFVGHEHTLYYTDGNYLGSIFPDTSTLLNGVFVDSFCNFTSSTTTGTISQVIAGTQPTNGFLPTSNNFVRVPAIFFTAAGGTTATAIATGVVYYLQCSSWTGHFSVFTLPSGGAPLDITTGATGTQYFNTFYPISAAATSLISGTVTITPQACYLPSFEISQSLIELGTLLLIGCQSNSIYPWNQSDLTPSSVLQLPENNTSVMINVHNMAYIFAGFKGNIYITDGSVVSHVYSVPDYCAGVPDTPTSYIEPYFVWGGAMYLRGRIYFSILDQTSSKTGNCGGIWSFVPTQNYFIQQDVGISLVLENQNSYGSYNGVATVLLPSQSQEAIAPQFWSAWYSTLSNALYGIDFTGTYPNGTVIVETDLIPTGTILGQQKHTFSNIEFKVASPFVSGEGMVVNYRLNGTDAWQSAGTVQYEGGSSIGQVSGTITPLTITAEASSKGQWMQLQGILANNGTSTFSGNRLQQIILR